MKLHLKAVLLLILPVWFAATATADQIVFTEIMYNPAGPKPEFIEIKNNSYTPRDIALWKFSAGVTYQFPDFSAGAPTAHLLGPVERIIVSSADPATTRAAYPTIPAQQRVFGPWTGSLNNGGERVSLDDKNGVTQISVKYGNQGLWPAAADGTGHSLVLINENTEPDDFRNWTASALARTNTSSAPAPVTVVNMADTWKYNIPLSDPGTSWQTLAFNDSGWGSGAALLGFENNAGIPAPGMVTTVGSAGTQMVYLFRKSFTYNGNTTATFSIDHLVDDGVSYYLNGNLIGSCRNTPGVWNAQATGAPGTGDATAIETNIVSGTATGLVSGTNVLSAEVHQVSVGSSDMVFGAKMVITPGAAGAKLRLSEVHFNALGAVDWVELENYSTSSQSAAGLFLCSKTDFSDKIALSGSVPANGFASYNVSFAAVGGDVKIILVDSSNNVLGAENLTHLAGRDSLQAVWPVTPAAKPTWEMLRQDAEWFSSTTATQAAVNSPPINTAIVINEIMCDPMSEQPMDEFIELYNKSGAPVTLTGWRLKEAVSFDFPAGTTIAAGGYLVVAANKAHLQPVYPSATMVGDWSGGLSNKGDTIRLVDQYDNLADEVGYHTGGDWPDFTANKGSSMELLNPNMDNNRASAWKASDDSAKATFATYSVSGTYQELFSLAPWLTGTTLYSWASPSDYKEIFFHGLKDSHIVLRNITLQLNGSGGNLLQNVGQMSNNGNSNTGWLAQGTHAQSFMDGQGLHIIADGHGDQRPNHVEVDCTGINQGSSYTLTFEAKWVSGLPRLVGTFWDHSMGKIFMINVPNNLGTAGAVNSRFNTNTPPQIDSVIHSPAVPKSTDTVKVTARVYSATAISTVQLWYRQDTADNSIGYGAVNMVDNGTGGDAVSGDGVYTASVSNQQVDQRRVQFYVQVTATNGSTCVDPPTGASRPAMWIVDNRTLGTDLRRQRFIMAAYDVETTKNSNSPYGGALPQYGYKYTRVSNHYFPMTFINNESDVYYLGEMHQGGSRWSRSNDGNMNRAKWKLPHDRTFRKREKSMYDWDLHYGGGINTRTVSYMLYLLGYPACNDEEFAYSIYNTDPTVIRNDNELTDNELLNRSFKNGSDGELYKVFEEWYYKDDVGDIFHTADWLYTGDEPIRYVTQYALKSRELYYDYAPLIGMFKAVNDTNSSRELLERTINTDLSMVIQAVRGVCGDWDWGGKNVYLYRNPNDGKMSWINWDNDASFSSNGNNCAVIGGQGSPTPGAPNVPVYGGVPDPSPLSPKYGMYVDKPWVRRAVNYYYTELIDKYCKTGASRTDAWLNAQNNAMQGPMNALGLPANGDNRISIQSYYDWWTARRTDVLAVINQNVGTGGAGNAYTATFAVTTSNSPTSASTINIAGTAPSSAYTVTIDAHPEAVFNWVNQTTWNLNGIVLVTGSNTFTFRMMDRFGAQVGSSVGFTITKTGNAPPVMKMTATPGSFNVTLGELLTLDSSGSFDPDNGALTYGWSSNPASGLTITHPVPATSQVTFSLPGIYSFTVTGTDPSSGATPLIREVAVASTDDFLSFGLPLIPAAWTVTNMENRDSYSNLAWYSLQDKPGSLVVQTRDDGGAKPLAFSSPAHPLMLRAMPASVDCAILTDLSLETRQVGSFTTGLYLETLESGVTTRYAFGLDGGSQIAVKRSTSGSFSNVFTQASTGGKAKLRIRRVGTQLRFERCTADVWSTLHTATLPGGATLVKGGIFVATSVVESVRVDFDYVMVVDPGNTPGSLLTNLRITEVMYHPMSPGTVEYIELKNVGVSSINLTGAYFEQGKPFDLLTFGSVPLNPGEYAVVTNDSAAFAAKYGAGILRVIQWPGGSLNNSGERVTLRDGDGNLIHDFSYGTIAPWPTTADGYGPSLEVLNTGGNYDDGANWVASGMVGGTPGSTNGGPDSDGDGMPDAWEAMFGTNPNDAKSGYNATTSLNGAQPMVTWPSVNGRQYRVEYCDNLVPGAVWQVLTTFSATGSSSSFTDPTVSPPAKRFYHVIAL